MRMVEYIKREAEKRHQEMLQEIEQKQQAANTSTHKSRNTASPRDGQSPTIIGTRGSRSTVLQGASQGAPQAAPLGVPPRKKAGDRRLEGAGCVGSQSLLPARAQTAPSGSKYNQSTKVGNYAKALDKQGSNRGSKPTSDTASTQADAYFCVNECGKKLTSVNRDRRKGYEGLCKRCGRDKEYENTICNSPNDEYRAIQKLSAGYKGLDRKQSGSRRQVYLSNRYMVKRYSLTTTEYYERLERQSGRCAICRSKPNGPRRLSIDHDHKTGKVRGLLCTRCNVGLALFDRLGIYGILKVFLYLGWNQIWNSIVKDLRYAK